MAFILALLAGAAFSSVQAAPPPTACADLVALVDSQPPGPLFLASYPTVADGPLHGAAFLYDNAVAAVALTGCGERARARRIGDAILAALARDRAWHDGRLRNGYAAGSVGAGSVRLAGWWDPERKMWLEDRYQAGSDNGNMAWAMLALLALDAAGAGPEYRAGAARIGRWVEQWQDSRGQGGFTGGTFGHEPSPQPLRWKATEHNTDLAAAFARLAAVDDDPRWPRLSAAARRFVMAMWDGRCACFAAGTATDGVTRNPLLALDAQIWPLLAIGATAEHRAAVLTTVGRRLATGGGFAYSEAGGAVWTEGTAQVALLRALLGQKDKAAALMAVIAGQRAPGGGYFATGAARLPTGFMLETDPTRPRLYFHLPHLAATAWAALAERHFNPFAAAAVLP